VARRRSSRRLNESPRAVSLKRILWHRHWHRRHRLLLFPLLLLRVVVIFFVVVIIVEVYATSSGSHRKTSCVSTDEDFQKTSEKPQWKPAVLQVSGVLRFNVSPPFPLIASKLPSAFLPLYPRDRNPLTHLRLYIYRHNKFQIRFQTVGARRQTWNSHARVRITLLLYRGLVNKLNQIRSTLSGNQYCLCLLTSLLTLPPRPFFFSMAKEEEKRSRW